MLETAKTQNVSSTKIYDLLIGLGANKKKAEFAIGEFVKDIPKILASHTTEKNLDPTVPVSRGDIWRLEAIIKENKNDTDLKLKDLEAVIKENKNDTDLKIEKMRTEAMENKNDTDLKLKDTDIKIERMRTEAEKNKNTLLFWGVTVQLAVGGLVITLLQFLRT